MRILSVQSWVVHGHVGNAACLFALQRLGAETLGMHTVQFSNHTGYGDWTGRVFPPDDLGRLADGIGRRGVLADTDAMLSGYVGDAATGAAMLDVADHLRRANPSAVWACDPVIGDERPGVFVGPGIVEFFRDRALPAADLLTPNQFELLLLARETDRSFGAVAGAAGRLLARLRPGAIRAVMVTSLDAADRADDAIDLLLVTDTGRYRLRTERIGIEVNGAGDLIASLFLFHALAGGDLVAAFERAANATWRIVRATAALGRRELALVAAQNELIGPVRSHDERFRAEPV